MMAFAHGLPKLQRILAGGELKFPDPIGLGTTASLYLAMLTELGASLLVMLGLFTRINSLFLAFTMFVAGFIQHASDPFKQKELALLYLTIYIMLIFTGPGKYSFSNFVTGHLPENDRVKRLILG
ncbi:MAG: DoxX family protein [Ignavibacteriaceae bacterium]|nr:DoxX family protein [Ignavibacteriaceae bacterium]